MAAQFNPADHNTKDTVAYLKTADADEVARVKAAEQEGGQRKTIMEWEPKESATPDAAPADPVPATPAPDEPGDQAAEQATPEPVEAPSGPTVTITAANPQFTGKRCGIAFAAGKAEVPADHPWLWWFAEHGYTIGG